MEASEEKKTEDIEIESEDICDDETPNVNDIEEVLSKAGHKTKTGQNGLTLGISLNGISGTRGVHVEVVQVLDLRKAMFGRSLLAIQAGILESINRPLDSLLAGVGLDDLLEEMSFLTPAGRVEFPVLRSPNNNATSLIHETRTVYTVFADGTTPRNVSWLTEESRVIPVRELGLLLSSDSRSLSNDVQKSIISDKWEDLEHGVKRAWMGLLPIMMGVVGLIGFIGALLSAGTIEIPLAVAGVSIPVGLLIIRGAIQAIKAFHELFDSEVSGMGRVGDLTKVKKSATENELRLHLVGTLNFIITPLMDTAASAIETSDVDGSVTALNSILDECVRLLPLSDDAEPP
ncbi:MAG: hypothetical protein ACXAAK_12770, partial [Candidatus Thorarchaeota archaeon]